MKYFIDTEFLEDFTRPLIGKPRHYIDLISIAIVAEDGREYYAISNEFDIDHVWKKYQSKKKPIGSSWHKEKEYWLRENVLWPLVHDAVTRYSHGDGRNRVLDAIEGKGRLGALKWVIKEYGKSNARIADEINRFVGDDYTPEFYGYYADYDWVLFCSLYGRMLDLPKDFPMYCRDLKQMYDERSGGGPLKAHPTYPKQSNTHHALDDARWNKKLYDFLKTV